MSNVEWDWCDRHSFDLALQVCKKIFDSLTIKESEKEDFINYFCNCLKTNFMETWTDEFKSKEQE